MNTDPRVTGQVAAFYRALDDAAATTFEAAVDRLAEGGPTLGRPTVAEVNLEPDYRDLQPLFGRHLKELRAGTVRVLFAFGPDRVPVLLYAGDKHGQWTDWYPSAIRAAARLYSVYLEEIA